VSDIVQRHRWRITAAIAGLSWLVTLAIFRTTAMSMVSTWQSATYSHGILILPVFIYMVWTCRSRILSLAPTPNWWAFPILLLLALGWLVGRITDVVLIEQLALVSMLQTLVWILAGSEVARILLFPLMFLYFAVPMGESLIPKLQDFTAYFAVQGLQLSNVPVLQEGRLLTTASGLWQVAEACSGVSFVISFAVMGCLYSFLAYTRWSRRLVFMLAALSLPILANGLRVYAVIMMAHLGDGSPLLRALSDATLQGWGHRLHGWVFFVLGAIALFWIGSRWSEPLQTASGGTVVGTHASFRLWPVALAAAISVVPLLPLQMASDALSRQPAQDTLMTAAIPRIQSPWKPWNPDVRDAGKWMPHFAGASAESLNSYTADGNVVDLYIALYTRQMQGAELINSENAIADSNVWTLEAEQDRSALIDGKEVSIHESTMRSRGGRQRLIWHWYWIAGQFTSNPYHAKFLEAKARLLGGPQAAAAMTLSVVSPEVGPAPADLMQDFLNHAVLVPQMTRMSQMESRALARVDPAHLFQPKK